MNSETLTETETETANSSKPKTIKKAWQLSQTQ